MIGTENRYLLIFTHDNTDLIVTVFSFEQFMIPSCETGHQGRISRNVLKHGISLVLRYILCSYLSLFYL